MRRQGDEIYFLKNGFECDFVVLKQTEPPVLIQVADVLHRDNLERELKGLEKGKKRIQNGRGVLLVNEIAVSRELIPAWVEVELAPDWLLK